MLILGATDLQGVRLDVRITGEAISEVGSLAALPGEDVLDARGGCVLPGLHDHHLHIASFAASLASIHCGPPEVNDPIEFAARLGVPGSGWLRATGYHESVHGMLDAQTLDRIVSHRPVRVQHRSGRMWFFNSAGLELLLAQGIPCAGLEQEANRRYTGRLFDDDDWLRRVLRSQPPSLAAVGVHLSRAGITGVSDLSPRNDATMLEHFTAERASESFPQSLCMAGPPELSALSMPPGITCGPVKLHLHEAHLPPLEDSTDLIRRAHALARNIAIHCVSEPELVFALAALEDAGVLPGDRIEHASLTPDWAVARIADLGLIVVAQPHFICERGDQYLGTVEPADLQNLYRLRAFARAGVSLAGGSDAPFGRLDPWASMAAAVSRRTEAGHLMGEAEALSPEEALDLYLCSPLSLWEQRRITVGMQADLCLLRAPWKTVRRQLASDHVRATLIRGRQIFYRVDESPA